MQKFILSVAFLLFTATSWAAQDDSIRVTLEEPSFNVPASGISNLRGWAVAPNGIHYIELFINDDYVDDIPYGSVRGDVGNAFPDIPNSDNSGFSMAWAYSALEYGTNHITIVAYDNHGNYNITETDFQVEKFNSSFIYDPNQVDLTAVDNVQILDKNRLIMQGVLVEGQYWDVELKWQTATQGFDIALIEPAGNTLPPVYDDPLYVVGTWVGDITYTTESEDCPSPGGDQLRLGIEGDSPESLSVGSLIIVHEPSGVFIAKDEYSIFSVDSTGYITGWASDSATQERVQSRGGPQDSFLTIAGGLSPSGLLTGTIMYRHSYSDGCSGTWSLTKQ